MQNFGWPRLLALMAVLAAALALNACNTVEGAGQDIKRAGQWLEKKANQAK